MSLFDNNIWAQEESQSSGVKSASHYSWWLDNPGCFAPTVHVSAIIFKAMTVHLRWDMPGHTRGTAPCLPSCQISHFQPPVRSRANQGIEKEVQEDVSSSVAGYQGLSPQNEGSQELPPHNTCTIHLQYFPVQLANLRYVCNDMLWTSPGLGTGLISHCLPESRFKSRF